MLGLSLSINAPVKIIGKKNEEKFAVYIMKMHLKSPYKRHLEARKLCLFIYYGQ